METGKAAASPLINDNKKKKKVGRPRKDPAMHLITSCLRQKERV